MFSCSSFQPGNGSDIAYILNCSEIGISIRREPSIYLRACEGRSLLCVDARGRSRRKPIMKFGELTQLEGVVLLHSPCPAQPYHLRAHTQTSPPVHRTIHTRSSICTPGRAPARQYNSNQPPSSTPSESYPYVLGISGNRASRDNLCTQRIRFFAQGSQVS
jgi:hypothetical protein